MTICLIKSHCESSKKVLNFFEKNNFLFTKLNISFMPLKESILYDIDSFKNDGIYEAINLNSIFFKNNNIDIYNMPKKNLIDLVIKNPEVLNMPICLNYDENKKLTGLWIGFSDSEYEKVLKNKKHQSYFSNISRSFIYSNCCIDCEVRDARISPKNTDLKNDNVE